MSDDSSDRRIPYDWARVTCPTCGSAPNVRCRTLSTNRVTDAHGRRHEMGNLDRYRQSLADRGYPVGDA